MLTTYRELFRARGSAAFTIAGFIAELPIAIYPIALVLTLSAREGHYGFAGVAGGVFVASGVPGAPLLSRLVDRLGQRRVMVPAIAVHVLAVLTAAVLLSTDLATWLVLPPVALAGFSYISIGSMVRARWSRVLAGRPDQVTTAYSLVSILEEAIFVTGPVLATVVAVVAPVAALYLAAALVAGGTLALAMRRDTEPPIIEHAVGAHRSPLRTPGLVAVLIATVFMGAFFASAEIADIAFCGQHGHRNLGGLVVALYALGSGLSGLWYGARRHHAPVRDRFRRQAVIFGLLPLLYLLAPNIAVLAVISFVAGTGTAPALIAAFALVEQIVPAATLTEGLTWIQVGLSAGFGAGAATVGGIADAHGARASFLVACAAGIAGVVGALVAHRLVSRASDDHGHTPVGRSRDAALP